MYQQQTQPYVDQGIDSYKNQYQQFMMQNDGNPEIDQGDSLGQLQNQLSESALHRVNTQSKLETSKVPAYNPYQTLDYYETTKNNADRELEMMLKLKQQNGSVGGNSLSKYGDAALAYSNKNLLDRQKAMDQTPYSVYHDRTDVPLNLNPKQVQKVEDQYLAYKYNSQTGFNPSQSGQHNQHQQKSTAGQYGYNPVSNQTDSYNYIDQLAASQLQKSSYNMALDKSTTPPLPQLNPNYNIGEHKMKESYLSGQNQPQGKNNFSRGITDLDSNSKAPAPQRHNFPADNPMQFAKLAAKAQGGLDKFSNVSSQGNPLNIHNPALMQYYTQINEQLVSQNPYKQNGRKGGNRPGPGGSGGMVQGRGGVAFNM